MPKGGIRVETVAALPRLAWVAEVPRAGGEVTVRCGAAVERAGEAIVEGVWDGPFAALDFDASEAFFGTGLRLRGERVLASASSAPVDRLLYAELADRTVVANSLPLLLAATGARLVLDHDYFDELKASQRGRSGQPGRLLVRHPELVELRHLHLGNLVLEAGSTTIEFRGRRRELASYQEYLGRLRGTIARLGENLASPARRTPLEAWAVVSSGYDSAAVACLARNAGVERCFTTRPGPGPDAGLEDGTAVAAALGLECRTLRHPSTCADASEVAFYAPTVWGSEVGLIGATRALAARAGAHALFTGHFGDVAWDVADVPFAPTDDLQRGVDDGLGLAEVRLVSGFVNVAVPVLFGRELDDLRRISRSPEMAPWRLGTRYDRPIPRRILESAGVPRALFGQRKRAIWEAVWEQPFDAGVRAEFVAWLDRRLPGADRRLRAFRALTALDRAVLRWSRKLLAGRGFVRVPFAVQRRPLAGHDARQLMFQYSNDLLADRYAAALGVAPPPP
jgi:hypothetical protein